MDWKDQIQILETDTLLLEPLEEKHIPELVTIATGHPEIWTHYVYDGSSKARIEEILKKYLQFKKEGIWLTFTIRNKKTGKILGSTSLIEMDQKNRNLEIGATWYEPKYWGTSVNPEAKLALLSYCFEILKTVRVCIKTDEKNIRSQKAIEKIGAQYEGTLRNEMIRDNGVIRNSKYYSFIDEEWPQTREQLKQLIVQKQNTSPEK